MAGSPSSSSGPHSLCDRSLIGPAHSTRKGQPGEESLGEPSLPITEHWGEHWHRYVYETTCMQSPRSRDSLARHLQRPSTPATFIVHDRTMQHSTNRVSLLRFLEPPPPRVSSHPDCLQNTPIAAKDSPSSSSHRRQATHQEQQGFDAPGELAKGHPPLDCF